MELESLLGQIGEEDRAAMERAAARWNSLAKPLGSLGLLEDAVVRIAGITGDDRVRLDRRALAVFCADNGVVEQGVTQCGSEVTAAVARALARGESTVCHMAKIADCSVIPVDVGIAGFTPFEGVLDRRIRNGTADITAGPAMTGEECAAAVSAGAALVRDLAGAGTRIVAVGEMGIGNTTTAGAVLAALLGLSPDQVVGRGAGLSDGGLSRKRRAVGRALEVNAPVASDPLDVLSKVGGLDLAAMCGAFLGAAACRIPALIDGMISSVAALCAVRLCPRARFALLASHVSAEPSGERILKELGLKPLITAGMRLGEGSGAVAALPLFDLALSVYDSGQTFGRLGIDAYTPQN